MSLGKNIRYSLKKYWWQSILMAAMALYGFIYLPYWNITIPAALIVVAVMYAFIYYKERKKP